MGGDHTGGDYTGGNSGCSSCGCISDPDMRSACIDAVNQGLDNTSDLIKRLHLI